MKTNLSCLEVLLLFFFSGVPSPISQRDDENTSPAYFLVEGQLWKLPSLVKVLLFFCFLVFFLVDFA